MAQCIAISHHGTTPHAPVEDWRASADRRIGDGQVHSSCDGGAPVAISAVSAPAAVVARVAPVHTPLWKRRMGYGATVAAGGTAAS